jgi:hypothetical protein
VVSGYRDVNVGYSIGKYVTAGFGRIEIDVAEEKCLLLWDTEM